MRGAACILTLNYAAFAAWSRALSRPTHLRALCAGQWPAWQPPRERRQLPRGPPGLQGLGTAPATRGCRVAVLAVALRRLPRLPGLDRVQPERRRREGGAPRPAPR